MYMIIRGRKSGNVQDKNKLPDFQQGTRGGLGGRQTRRMFSLECWMWIRIKEYQVKIFNT